MSIYKIIRKEQVISDMQDRGFTLEASQAIHDYLESNYDVTDYEPDMIANQFDTYTLDYIKEMCQTEYKEFYNTFFLDYTILKDKDYILFWEDVNQYNFITHITGTHEYLFDKQYYGRRPL